MSATTGSDQTNENRRRGGRHSLDIPATLSIAVAAHAEPSAADLLVKIVQMSMDGIALLADRALHIGEMYHVNAFDSLIPVGMRVRVVSVRPSELHATYLIGAEVVG